MGELHWNAEALHVQLETLLPGLAIEIVAETGSTNTDLLEGARRTAQAGREIDDGIRIRRSIESRAYADSVSPQGYTPRLLVAERQTGGRGRQGRPWHAEPGASLTFSLALALDVADWSGLSLAVGVALAEALDPLPATPPRLALKWPNDLWLVEAPGRGRKLGGVLIETAPLGTQRIAVIGIGLNVRPIAARDDLASGYACAAELDPDAAAPQLLARVALPLAKALRGFERNGFEGFSARYAARDLLCGQAVRTTLPDLPEGIAEGVTAHGGLLVRPPAGPVRVVSSGEVSVRLAPTASAGARAAA